MPILQFAKTLRSVAPVVVLLGVAVSLACAQEIVPTSNGAVVHSVSGLVRVEVCSDAVIHITAGPTADQPTQSLVPTVIRPCEGARFTTSSDPSRFYLLTKELKVAVDRHSGAVKFLTLNGSPVLGELSDNGRDVPSVTASESATGVSQRFSLTSGEALYGLGQHQEGFFDVRDIPVELLQANTNISIPFLLSTKGYGLLWNNPSRTEFNPPEEAINLDRDGVGTFRTGQEGEYGFLLSGNYRDKLKLSVDDKQIIDLKNMWLPHAAGARLRLPANTSYRVTAESGGETQLAVRPPSDSMEFRSDAGKVVDYYFFYGPGPSNVIAEYREFTGEVPMLPRWAFGFWQCRERYSSQQQILDTAAEFRNRGIPVDVLVQDWQYWGKYGWNAMRFDESHYPAPAAMLSALHRENLHMVISVWAKFGADTEIDHQMVASNLVLRSAASTGEPGEAKETENWADLFNPQARTAFWSDINRNLFSLGLDGWWLDASEPEGDPLKNDMTYLGPGTLVRNAFPLFETSAVYQGQRAVTNRKRVVILSRSAYAGQQRNGTISWSGDISANWDTFRRQIPAGLSFGMSGFPYWTTDIGGFFRPADQYTSENYHELLIRWFQFGAFCPIFRIHGFRSETEMWKYGPEVERILRRYDDLRYRLLPYIYSAAWGVSDRGEVLMKALPFVYPNDVAVRGIGDEFLFGDSLLVSPVTQEHATTRSVVLPSGDNWVDFWTAQTYKGGQTIVAEAPLDQMPILVKQGSILPLGPVIQSASGPEEPLEIRVYGGKDASYDLYEDSGDGYAYERGARATIHLHWNDHQRTLVVGERKGSYPGMLAKRTLHIILVKPGHGTGDQPSERTDRTISYVGKSLEVKFANAH